MSANKLTTLSEAVGRLVRPGSSLYVTGFSHLIGFAAGHEIIRRRIEGLTLIRLTPDVVYDQMVAAGCAEKLVFSYLGNPGVGHLSAIRRGIESGSLDWTEYTHGSLIAALRAGASGAPFVPVQSLGATDLAKHNPDVRFVESPYSGDDVAVLPPLRPDVAIVHVQRADAHGNAQAWGALGELQEAAFAARSVIVTAEEIVPASVIRSDPNRTVVLAPAVDAVVRVPWGAHPSFVQGHYSRDNRFYRAWADITASEMKLARWLDEEVYGVPDREAYAARHESRLAELAQIGDGWAAPVNYGDNAAIAATQE